jgi:sulfate permease, SulP family
MRRILCVCATLQLLLPVLLIPVIGFVESVSVAQTLAAWTLPIIDPEHDLIGLEAANMGPPSPGAIP